MPFENNMKHLFMHGIKLLLVIPGQKRPKPENLGYSCVFFTKIITSLFICFKYAHSPELACKFSKSIRSDFIIVKNISMFEPSCVIGMAFVQSFRLKVGNKGFHLGRGRYEWGVFTSRFKTDISRLIPSLSWNKNAQKLSQSEEVFFLKSSPGEA